MLDDKQLPAQFVKTRGLAGASPEYVYEVRVELGVIMTANDILDGIMRITYWWLSPVRQSSSKSPSSKILKS